MTPKTVHYETIDDYLGSSEKRFFGSGFKRVEHYVRDVSLSSPQPGVPGRLRARASLVCPPEWSRKGEIDQRPHLSTVDAVVLSAQLSEALLNGTHSLDAAQKRQSWLRRVEIRAGSVPIENLDDLALEAVLSESQEDGSGARYSTFDCKIDTMKVRCEIVHAHAVASSQSSTHASLDEMLGEAVHRPYGAAFKSRKQDIRNVSVDVDSLSAQADVQILTVDDGHTVDEGLEADYWPSVSMIDCFVTSLQLGQTLLYGLDGVERSASNTLWMRKTVLESSSPCRPASVPFVASVSLVNSQLIEVGGGVWRTADVTGSCHGIQLRCAVAHLMEDGYTAEGNPHRLSTVNGYRTKEAIGP